MNWKAPAGCVATAAALAAVAGVLSSDHVFQPAVKPLLLAALGLIAVAVLIPASGVLMLVWAVLRGFGRPRRKLPPVPGGPTVSVGPDNSALVGQLQGLREKGRPMIWQAGRSGVDIRLLGDQAAAWYREVRLALDPYQRRRFTTAAGPFNTTSGLDISVSLDRHLAVLDEIINDMCYVPPAPSVEHMAYLMRGLGQSPVLPR
jgi:hypothetical protein